MAVSRIYIDCLRQAPGGGAALSPGVTSSKVGRHTLEVWISKVGKLFAHNRARLPEREDALTSPSETESALTYGPGRLTLALLRRFPLQANLPAPSVSVSMPAVSDH